MEKIILHEFGKAQKLPETEWHHFENYLQEVWQNRLFGGDVQDQVSDSITQRLFDLYQGTIRARNYSGYLRFDHIEIQIFPKIFATDTSPEAGLVFRHLNYYLSYCFSLHVPFFQDEADTQPNENLLNLWIQLFVQFTWQFLSQKPHFAYENLQEQNPYFKGRLATSEYIRTSMRKANWHQPINAYSKLTYDNRFNRLIKYVFEHLIDHLPTNALEEKVAQILRLLHDCKAEALSISACQKLRHQTPNPIQKTIISFCEIYLFNKNINEQIGAVNNFAFLLPMESIFEQFIYGFIATHFPEEQAQYQSSSHLARNEDDGKTVFLVKQDIYLPHRHRVIDTKYKLRTPPFADANTGVASQDMYQMLSYALARDCRDLLLVYPSKFQEPELHHKIREFVIQSKLLGNEQIRIKACDLDITEAQSENFKTRLDQKIKAQLEKLLFEKG
ncbi:MAG: hypothetical protein NW226_10170 [Microscillaceae bacterium]|nr:hypothetical protein [Microscillaceae bacterium]